MTAKTANWRPGPTVCRCCLAEGCYKDISTEYFWMGKREVYAEMLSDTFSVSISYSKSGGPNSNSRLICEPCISRLRDASEFRRQVLDCEKTFMQHLDPGSSSAELPEELASLDEVKVERVKIERDTASDDDFDTRADLLDDDDDDDDLDDQPLTKFASKVPKKELKEVSILEELLGNSEVSIKRKSSLKPKQSPTKKLKRSETVKATSSKALVKTIEKKKKGLKEGARLEQPAIVWKKKRTLIEDQANAALIVEHSNAVVFRWQRGKFMCAYCPKICPNIHEIRSHMAAHNEDKLEIFNYPKIRHSFPLKIDITDLSCNLCDKKFSFNDLKTHLNTVHRLPWNFKHTDGVVPFALSGKELRCVQCDLQFERFMPLFVHMNEHYSTFVCDTCGKSYASQKKLRSHRAVHASGEFPCPQCNMILETLTAKNRHIVHAHGSKDRYRCPFCNDYFESYHSRLKHMGSVHGDKTEYKCSYCPAVFISSTSRYVHVKRIHIMNKRKLN